MAWQILVIGGIGSPDDCPGLPPGCLLDRLEWNLFVPAQLRDCRADLIIPIVTADCIAPIELFRWIRENPVRTPLFAILPANASEQLLCVTAEAAADFAIWPAQDSEILRRIARILGEPRSEVDVVRDLLRDEIGFKQLVGKDPGFLRMIEQIPLLARSNRPLLITGETGTGKELCARAIHYLSKRRNFPFIPIDCGAFPDHLFENEMFGHVRGAFTDAHREQRGLVAIAEGGTLFLDEIDSLSPSAQAKLLRFLQERTYRPLGSDKFARADVNVLAATNRDLDEMVREKHFRVDLFFRLSVLRLHTMPLRERPGDIPILARHFLDTLCAEEGIPRKTFAPTTLMALQRSKWPGNVRELYNVVQRAFVFARGSQVLPSHIAPAETAAVKKTFVEDEGFRAARARAIAEFERYYVIEILRTHNGNITQAARSAHKDRRAFGRLVKRHKIDRRSI